MDFDEDGYIIANDDEGNVWKGLEFYTFLFDELFNYNEDGTVDLVDNKDLDKLKEYRKKYEIIENNKIEPTEKENEDIEQAKKVISLFDSKKSQNNNSVSQLTLFAPREQELADRIVDIFNSFDTKYKGTFYVDEVKLEKWDHIKSKKRNLSILIKSSKCTGYNETSFTQFNTDKEEEILLRESVDIDSFLKYLNKDKDFSVTITPTMLMVYYHNFDDKEIDLSIGRNEVLASVNDNKNVEIIDNPTLKTVDIPVKKKTKEKLSNYVLHPEIPYEERLNYKITDNDFGAGTETERYRNNIEAIKTLKKCEEED